MPLVRDGPQSAHAGGLAGRAREVAVAVVAGTR